VVCLSTKVVLRINGNQLDLTRLLNTGFCRSQPGTPQLRHNSYGTPVTDGLSFEPRFLFEIEALVTRQEAALLDLIFRISQHTKQPVRIYDYTRPHLEPLPRTRAIAPSSTEENPIAGWVSYFPRYQAWFQSDPVRTVEGSFERVKCALLETKIVAP
jgi:hypothetical protein